MLWVDPNGRDVRTADPDARDGHRSATNSRRAGIFTGHDLHNFVQVRDVRSSDGRENVVFGPDVPPVLTRFTLAPAGSPPDATVVPQLQDMNRDERRLRDVLVDRGYSQLSASGMFHPVRRAGMELTFQPKGDHQRLQAPFSESAVLIDGQLFSAWMPKHLWQELPWPPTGERGRGPRVRAGLQQARPLALPAALRPGSRCCHQVEVPVPRRLPAFTPASVHDASLKEHPAGPASRRGEVLRGIHQRERRRPSFRQKLTPGTTA